MGDAACRSTTRIIGHTTAAHPWSSDRTCGFISAMEAIIDPGTTTITRAAACPWISDRACGFISAMEAIIDPGTPMMSEPCRRD
jgi:hypothetical protein